jgi:hypothetical protein
MKNEILKTEQPCTIHGVSNMLNSDNYPTFDEWLNKYFHQPEQTLTYKERKGRNRIPIDVLKKKYMKAYNVKI